MSEPLSQTKLDFVLSQILRLNTPCNAMEIIKNHSVDQAVTIVKQLDQSTSTSLLLMFCVQAGRGDSFAKELLANAIALEIPGVECVIHAYSENET